LPNGNCPVTKLFDMHMMEPPAAGTAALRIYGVSSLSLWRYALTACVCGSRHTVLIS